MARILLFILAFALLIGSSPLSNHMTSPMDAMMTQHGNMAGENGAGEKSTMPCCNEVAQFSISCAFLVPEYGHIELSGGSVRVGISTALVQSIYLKAQSPPPKA
jgi:hypothetical protein